MLKILLFANTDWYLYNFRLALAKELRAQGHEVVLLSPPGDFQKLLHENGFRWIPFPLSRQGTNPVNEIHAIWRLMRIYRQVNPDIVHHFTIKPVIYGSLSAHILGIKGIINSITGLGHLFIDSGAITSILRGFAKMLYRISLRRTQVIFENPEDRETFIQNRLLRPEQTNLILGTGVDVEKFQPVSKNNDVPLILFASRLLVTKGVTEFVEVAGWIRQKGFKARFAIVGTPDPGNPASIPLEQMEAWKGSNMVEIWGWQDDMPAVLAKADIFCLPSYREGVPSALLEACASGLPIVTTNVPGCRDVVTNGINGVLVHPRDPHSLAVAIEKLLVEPTLRNKMGNAGRIIALEKFSLERNIQQNLAVYQKSLAS